MKRNFLILFFVVSIFFLSSCDPSKNYNPPVGGNVLISNLCPDSPPIDVYVNGTIGAQALPFTYYYPYSSVAAGTANLVGAETGSSSSIFNANIPVVINNNYSFFIIDSLNAITTAYTLDNLALPSSDSAKVRILDFAPNAGFVDVANPNGGSIIDSARAFNDQTIYPFYASFFSVAAGNYSFDVRKSGTSSVLLSSSTYAPFSFSAGKIYTLVLTGFVGSTGTQAFSISAINNN